MPERVFGDDLAAMRDRDDAAGSLRSPYLEFDPAADIADCRLQPGFQWDSADVKSIRMIIAIGGNVEYSAAMPDTIRTKQNRRNP